MPRPGGVPRSRGAYGSKRGKTVEQVKRARANNKRVQSTLAEVRTAQRRLDERIRSEAEAAAIQEAQRAELRTKAQRERAAEQHAAMLERRKRWPLADARQLVRSGYSVDHTVRRTGWPPEMLEDVRPGEW